ncbi:MAG: HAD family hydrolase, partial [Acidobacteria bacterium]|nr:HAD family hydrolase [Acidobacteriota bacterium]
LLLITNSEWYYTDAICRHLFDGAEPGLDSWRQVFDLVVVEAKKPRFFKRAHPFQEVVAGAAPGEQGGGSVATPAWGGTYAGGSRAGLMELLDCLGEQVLYVGDHIYGDILSSKRVSTWRTALVVRELEDELVARRELTSQHRHAEVLRSELADFGRRMDDVRDLLLLYRSLAERGELPEDGDVLKRAESYLEEMRREHKVMRLHKNRLQGRISDAINPYWGSVFKQGSNKSLFGSQVDDFACIYTSRVSNLSAYGSHHYFRVLEDPMMHDTLL